MLNKSSVEALVAKEIGQASTSVAQTSNGQEVEVHVNVKSKTWEIKQLQQLFEELGSQDGGIIQMTDGDRPKTIKVTVRGNASFVYSVYSPFFNAENHLNEEKVEGQSIGKFTIILDGLKQKLQERNSLKFVQDYLSLQGFDVDAGGKPSPRVFPEATEFKEQNAVAFKQRFGISLGLANQIHQEVNSRVIMPFAFAAETGDKRLKDDINFCFKELNLIAANGQPKECIDLKNGRFLANIGSSQALLLEKHFQQRAMLLNRADEAMKETVKKAGNPLRSIEMIRAGVILLLNNIVPKSPDAASKLLASSLGHPIRLIDQRFTLSQEAFVRSFEKAINDHFIIGPSSFDLFLSPSPFMSDDLHDFVRLLSSLDISDASHPVAKDAGIIPHKPEYLRQYPALDANHNIAFHLKALDPRRSSEERQNIVRESGVVKDRLEQIRQFRVRHSPFYLIQQMTDKLSCLLQGAKEDKMTEILKTLGLSEEQMSTFKIIGPNLSRFNVYHIEFMLPLLVLNYCMNHAILLRPQCALQVDLQGFLYDPHNNVTATDATTAWRGLEWAYNAKFQCGWSAGESRRYDYSSFGSFFGGSSTHTGMGTSNTPPIIPTTSSSTYSES